MTRELREALRAAIDHARREQILPPPEHRCPGCDRDKREHEYTERCKHCTWRRNGRDRRADPVRAAAIRRADRARKRRALVAA